MSGRDLKRLSEPRKRERVRERERESLKRRKEKDVGVGHSKRVGGWVREWGRGGERGRGGSWRQGGQEEQRRQAGWNRWRWASAGSSGQGYEEGSRVTKVVDQYGVYLPLKTDPSEEERAEKKQGGRVRGGGGSQTIFYSMTVWIKILFFSKEGKSSQSKQ